MILVYIWIIGIFVTLGVSAYREWKGALSIPSDAQDGLGKIIFWPIFLLSMVILSIKKRINKHK